MIFGKDTVRRRRTKQIRGESMGNSIILEKRLEMNARLTSEFVSVLVLSGLALATTEQEKALVAYLASRGEGASEGSGFCVNQMPWDRDHFEVRKMFVQRIVDGALAKTNWHLLGFEPQEDLLIESLTRFKRLLSMFSSEDILQDLGLPRPDHVSLRKDLYMSNGATDVFVSVLVLSGSALATTEQEKILVAFLAGRDQSRFGIGTVGFLVNQMPWDRDHFEADRAFLQKVIDGALAKTNWHMLGYEPREDWTVERLTRFKNLLSMLSAEDIQAEMAWPKPDTIKLCERHHTVIHYYGCYFCNEMSEAQPQG
jgi:hypothetical protein